MLSHPWACQVSPPLLHLPSLSRIFDLDLDLFARGPLARPYPSLSGYLTTFPGHSTRLQRLLDFSAQPCSSDWSSSSRPKIPI